MSAYRTAIDRTTWTIDRRARHFRNLIVAVVALGLGSIAWTAASWSPAPLAGLLLLLPACGLFFFRDARALNDWRAGLIDAWVQKEIDFKAFCDAIYAIPALPQDTVQSMLATLPNARNLVAEQGISSATREAIAAAVAASYASQSDIVALKTVAAAIMSGSIFIAAAGRSWGPVFANVALIAVPVLRKGLKQRRARVWNEKLVAARTKLDFDNEKYQEAIAYLQSQQNRTFSKNPQVAC